MDAAAMEEAADMETTESGHVSSPLFGRRRKKQRLLHNVLTQDAGGGMNNSVSHSQQQTTQTSNRALNAKAGNLPRASLSGTSSLRAAPAAAPAQAQRSSRSYFKRIKIPVEITLVQAMKGPELSQYVNASAAASAMDTVAGAHTMNLDADATSAGDARQRLMKSLIPAAEEPKEQQHKNHLPQVLSDILMQKVCHSERDADKQGPSYGNRLKVSMSTRTLQGQHWKYLSQAREFEALLSNKLSLTGEVARLVAEMGNVHNGP